MSRFNPYENNGGTVAALSYNEFAILAADTRMTNYGQVVSRNNKRWIKLTNKAILASGGFSGDIRTFQKLMAYKVERYRQEHERDPSLEAIASMLTSLAYSRRFFPYYSLNILAGITSEGQGRVYQFDAIGSGNYLTPYTVSGSGSGLAIPIIDSRYKYLIDKSDSDLQTDMAELLKDALEAISQRDVYTGDGADIIIITADGIKESHFPLRAD